MMSTSTASEEQSILTDSTKLVTDKVSRKML